jgi:hypothetical protein
LVDLFELYDDAPTYELQVRCARFGLDNKEKKNPLMIVKYRVMAVQNT